MSVRVTGVEGVLAKLKQMEGAVTNEVDKAIEKRTLLVINDTRVDAPRKTGKLKNSIDLITQETKPMSRTYGTNVEYARRQEYEHKVKKAFFRNNIAKHKPLLAKDIGSALRKAFGGK